MAISRRNHLIDVVLVVFLSLAILSLSGPRSDHQPDIKTYVHASSGILLTLGVFVHIVLHRRWFRSVLARAKTGSTRAKPVVYGCMALFMILAFLSGFAEIASPSVNVFHHVTGLLALLCLGAHTVRRLTGIHRIAQPTHLNRRRTVHRVCSNGE